MGKTRLVAELAARAAPTGASLCSPAGAPSWATAVPYLPLADALRERDHRPVGVPAAARRAGRPAGARPAAARPGHRRRGRAGMSPGPGPAAAVRRGARPAGRAGRAAAGAADPGGHALGRPVHPRSADVPEPGAAPGAGGRGVATYRTDDLHRRHPLRPVVAELLRLPSVAAIELGPLPDAAMAEHLTALAMGGAERGVAGPIIRRAEGNPYYAEELLAAGAAARQRAARRAGRAAAGPGRAAVPGGPAGAPGRRGRPAAGWTTSWSGWPPGWSRASTRKRSASRWPSQLLIPTADAAATRSGTR